MRTIRTILIGFVALTITARHTTADELALTFTSGFVNTSQTNWMAGWRFVVNNSIHVDALGLWDFEQDGLSSSHPVGIWTDDGNLVASGTVAAGPGAPINSGFRMVSIAPTPLNAGATYRIAAYLDASNADGIITAGALPITSPSITYLNRAFLQNANAFAFPSGANNLSLAGNFGPTFQIGVPEASLVGAFAWMSLFMRRRGQVRR